MNGHMLKAIKAEAAPTIAFSLKSYDLLDTNDEVSTRMNGTLTLGGTTRDITIDAGLVQEADGSLRVKGSYDLRLTEYGLKPPSLMMGSMKVGDLVKVNFDLLLKD
jgi:polyisoprenoid-binding protein YceI